MTRLNYSPESINDLENIYSYIAQDDPQAAERTVERIQDDIDRLALFPEIGKPLNAVCDIDSRYRFVVSGSYLSFYRCRNEEVYIDRILSGRMDYLRVLFGEKGTVL